MKPKSALRSYLAIAGSSLLAISYTHAATYYWDNNGTTAGFGGPATGTWDSAGTVGSGTLGWGTDITGLIAPTGTITTASTNATTDSINFGTATAGLTGGTITIAGTVEAGNITFGAASGAIVLSGGTAINLTAASTIRVNNATNTIGTALTGAATSFTKAGTGNLILTGANSYGGTTIINGGTLTLNRQTGSLASTPLTFSGTGTFNMNNVGASGALAQTLGALSFSAGQGTVQISRTAAFDQAITFASVARTAGATGNFVHLGGTNSVTNGIILTFAPAAGTLIDRGIFFNGSSYATYDAGGFVRGYVVGDTNGLAAPAGTTIGASTATSNVFVTGAISEQTNISANTVNLAANSITMGGTNQVLSTNGILSNGSAAATLGGGTTPRLQATAAGNEIVVRVNGASDVLTISSAIRNFGVDSGGTASAITKTGAGTLIIGTLPTATGGLNINAGTVQYNLGNTLANAITIDSGASLTNSIGFGGTTIFSGTVLNNGIISRSGNGSTTFNNAISGTGRLDFLASAGGLSLNGNNTFIGGLNVQGAGGGTNFLNVGNNGALGAGTFTWGGGPAFNINVGNYVNSNNNAMVLNADLVVGGGNNANFGTGALTLGLGTRNVTNANTLEFGGAIGQDAAGRGYTKLGGGTLIFSGSASNTYTGLTTVSAGALSLGKTGTANAIGAGGLSIATGTTATYTGASTDMIANGAPVTIAGTGLLNLNGVNDTIGALTFTAVAGNNTRVTTGAGILTLNGGVTFTAATTGTAQITGNLDLGAATRTFSVGLGTAVGQDLLVSAPVTGSGGLTKTGTGRLTLAGTNGYTGLTTVTTGTLMMTAPSSLGNGGLNVAASQSFIYQPTTAGALNLGSGAVTLAGGTYGTALGGTASQSAITTSGAATLSGTGTINIFSVPGVAPTAGINNLISAGSGLGAGGTYSLGTVFNNTNYTVSGFARSATAISVNVTSQTALADAYWRSGQVTGFLGTMSASTGTLSNWGSDVGGTASGLTPGASTNVIFGATTTGLQSSVTTGGLNMSVNSITFNDSTAVTIAGLNTITLNSTSGTAATSSGSGTTVTAGSAISVTSSANIANTISANLALGANQTWNVASGRNLTVSGAVSGASSLTKADVGTLTLSNASNSYSGGTNLAAGTLSFASGALGTAGNVTFTGNSTLQWNGANTTDLSSRLVMTNGVASTLDTVANAVTFASAIGNSTTGSLTKAGSGTLTLSVAPTYTGSTTINAGTLNFSSGPASFSTSSIIFSGNSTLQTGGPATQTLPNMTVNSGVTATFDGGGGGGNSLYTMAALTSGSSTSKFVVTSSGGSGRGITFGTLAGFTGTLEYNIPNAGGFFIATPDLTDTAGTFVRMSTGNTSATTLDFRYTGSSALTLNNRQFELFGTTANATYNINVNNASGTLTINKDLLVSATGAKILALGGTGTGVFGGNIANGAGAVITVTKNGAGTWRIGGNMSHTGGISFGGGTLTLAGTNTYSGATNFTAPGITLIFAGIQAVSPNTTFVMNTNSSTSDSSARLLDDTGGVNNSLVTATGSTFTIQNSNSPGNAHTFIVGNNNTANGGTSSGITTGSTIAMGTLNWGSYASGTTAYGPIQVQGTNGYRLQINSVVLHNAANNTSNVVGSTFFTPTTANLTLGSVTVGTGNVNQGIQNLTLDGTSSDNRITGIISNASDFGTSNRALTVTKSNTSTWTLSGTSTYTGTTSVAGGTLIGTNAVQSFGTNLSGITIAAAGTLSLRNNGTVSFTNGTSAYNIANSASGATINVDRVSGTGTNTITVGNLTTTSTAAAWGLNFTGANGVSLTAGTLNTPISTVAATHTITNSILGGGLLTLGSVFDQATTVAAPALVFTGPGNTTVTGAITQTLASMVLTKSGPGTLTLQGNNTYTGITTVNGTGTLLLDMTGSGALSASSALSMGGGNFNILGKTSGATTQTLASLTTSANTVNAINLTPNGGTSTTLTITSATLATGAGSTVNFNYLAGGAGTTNGASIGNAVVAWNPTLTGPIIGGAYTVTDAGGSGYATTSAGNVIRYADPGSVGLPRVTGAAATNYFVGSSYSTSDATIAGSLVESLTGNVAANTVTVDTTGLASGANLNLGIRTLTLSATGGMLFSGANPYTIDFTGAGGITSAASSTITLNNFNTSSAGVTLNAPILNATATVVNFAGTGRTVLNGLNTYTGATNIGTGTLQIGSNGTLTAGTYTPAISIATGGTLQYSSSAAQTLSGAITGGGGLTKDTNSSILTLSSATTAYTGPTIINAGTLSLVNASAFASPTTVNASGTLRFAPTANASINNAAATVDLQGAMVYNTAGNFFQTTNGAVTVNATSTIALTSVGISSAGLFLDGGLKGSANLTVTSNTNGLGLVLRNVASDYSGTMTVNGTASTVSGTGSGLAINGPVSMSSADLTINGTLELGNAATGMGWAILTSPNGLALSIDALNGSGVVVGNMATAGSTRVFSVGNNNGTGGIFSGVIANGTNNTLSFIKAGSGTQTLSGANTYSGATLISAGTLQLGNGGTTGRLTATTSIANAGNLTINRSDAFSQATDLGAGVIISGTGSFTQAGAGTTTLTGINTYTGATNVNAGTLSLGHATNTLANTGVVNVNGGILALGANSDTVGSVTLASGSITGSGTLTAATYSLTGGTLAAQLGAGAVTVNGAVTFSAAGRLNASSSLLIQGGTLTLAGDETVASFQQTGGTIAGGFGINSASDFELESGTLSGKMGGTGGLKKRGGGKTTITGNNTYTGATDIMEGTLLVNGSTAAGSTVAVSAGATLGGTGTIGGIVNVSGVLSPGASIETLGTGTLSLTNGSSLVHELNSGVATAVGSDLLVVTGNLNLAGTVGLTLSDLTTPTVAFNVNDVFSIINYTGVWNGGLFTFGGNELANAEEFSFGLNTWRIDYNAPTGGLNFTGEYAGGSDSFVNLTVIPEPDIAALIGAFGAILLLRRKR